MIDAALSNPESNPIESFNAKPHDKTTGKKHVTVKQEPQETQVKCDQCEKYS